MLVEKIFQECYDRHFDDVFNYLYWVTKNEDLAKDLCQSCFETLWVRLEKDQKELDSSSGWLLKVAQNKIQEYFRVQKRRIEKLELFAEFSPSSFENHTNLSRSLELKETEGEIGKALAGLGSPLSEIVYHVDVEKKTYKEVEKILNLSERTIRRMRRRAWLKLEKEFEKLELSEDVMEKVRAITKTT